MGSVTTLCETAWCPSALRRGQNWCMDDMDLLQVVGESHLATVACCRCARSGLDVAVKMYHKERMTALNQRQVLREIRLHARLQHPSIIALYAAFEDADGSYLVEEFGAGGSLSEELGHAGGYLPEQRVAGHIMPAFLSALAHMHAQGILHRDIKPENVLLAASGDVRLADFGLALDLASEQPRSCVGTLDYMPPEACMADGGGASACPGTPSYGLPADVWSTGVLAYELLVGGSPFEADTKEETYGKVLACQVWMPAHLSAAAHDFIRQALSRHPEDRPTAAQLLSHPWLERHNIQAKT